MKYNYSIATIIPSCSHRGKPNLKVKINTWWALFRIAQWGVRNTWKLFLLAWQLLIEVYMKAIGMAFQNRHKIIHPQIRATLTVCCVISVCS